MQVESTVGMAAHPDQFVDHDHQGGAGPFQVRRKQADNTAVGGVSVKALEPGRKALFVKGKILYIMMAVTRAGGAAALEHSRGSELRTADGMGLEKADRQKGDLRDRLYQRGIDTQGIGVLAVDRVILILEPEKIQCPGCKVLPIRSENPVF